MHPARLSLPWNFGILLRAVLVQSTSTVMASQHYKAFLELKVLSKNLLGSRRQASIDISPPWRFRSLHCDL